MGVAPEELEAFCEAQFPRLVGALGLYVGDRLVAEELAQETLIRVCRRWESVRSLDSPGGWAHRVGLNLANSHFRRVSAERRARQRWKRDASPPQGEADADLAVVREAVARLPRRQRTAVVLRYFLGWRSAEVAEYLGVSSDAVRALTSRAFTQLRQELGSLDLEGSEVTDVHRS